ncbi:MAG: helix-turn-helix domain-containing protein [Candidatus Hydrogenedentes bacterium]|nr:helix-turn-helix domain-containing protein [Candidatus Hydrogenedentota bacterium]
MAKSFSRLQSAIPPARREQNAVRAQTLMAEMRLDELRKAMTLTQQQMAETLQMSQTAVSKIERQADMYVSTLRRYVAAMGGELKVIASFPDGDVAIEQFAEQAHTE